MRKKLARVGFVLIVAGSFGCAQMMALDQPGPLECRAGALAAGTPRANTIGCLGAPTRTIDGNDDLIDSFTYEDGRGRNSTASKVSRTFLYTVGDLFTLFLTQLVFVPAEALMLEAATYRADVVYEQDGQGVWRVHEATETQSD